MNKIKFFRVASPLVMVIVFLLIKYPPFFLIGSYSFMFAILFMGLLIASVFGILVGYGQPLKKNDWYGVVKFFLGIVCTMSFIVGIFGVNGRFENFASNHLKEEGTLTKAVITNMKVSMRKRRKSSDTTTTYIINYSFFTQDNQTVKSTRTVTEAEYLALNVGDSIPLAYLANDPYGYYDLILNEEKKELYKVKLAEFEN